MAWVSPFRNGFGDDVVAMMFRKSTKFSNISFVEIVSAISFRWRVKFTTLVTHLWYGGEA